MAKKKTIKIIVIMIIISAVVISFYYYQSYRTDSPKEGNGIQEDEINNLLEKDLKLNYPSTPRGVLSLYNRMIKVLYSDIKDEQVEELGLKIRELYDEELLDKNNVDDYLFELINDVAIYKETEKIIRTYEIDDEDKIIAENKDGHEYSFLSTTYRMNDKSGFYTVVQQFILRKDEDSNWKILGWKITNTINDTNE